MTHHDCNVQPTRYNTRQTIAAHERTGGELRRTAAAGPVRSDQIRSDQIRSDQIRSDQIRSDQIRSDQVEDSDRRWAHREPASPLRYTYSFVRMTTPLIRSTCQCSRLQQHGVHRVLLRHGLVAAAIREWCASCYATVCVNICRMSTLSS